MCSVAGLHWSRRIPLCAFNVKGKADELCLDAQCRKIKEPLVRKWNDSVHLPPLRAVCSQPRVGHSNLEFSAGAGVFVDEGESVAQCLCCQGNYESRVAFAQRTAHGAVVDNR